MKHLLVLILMTAATAGTAMAQGGDRGGRGGGQMREAMKEQLKTELKLTDAHTDSVLNVQQDFQAKSREVRMNSNLSDDDKKEKMKQLNEARKEKLKVLLNAEQANKLEAFYENMRKRREERQGGQPNGN